MKLDVRDVSVQNFDISVALIDVIGAHPGKIASGALMALVFGSTKFFVPSGQTFFITSAIHGNTNTGGDYVGPMLPLAVPDGLHQTVDISTVNVEFLSVDPGGLTSRCVYHYSITNNNPFGVTVRLDKFFDG